jgi:hypothetical protein
VFYELGVRHGARARFTMLLSAEGTAPFDVALLRALRYQLGPDGKVSDAEVARVRATLTTQLDNGRQRLIDSTASDNPVATLLQDFKALDKPSRFKADVFRDATEYSEDLRRRFGEARTQRSVAMLREIEESLPSDTESAALVDLMLSYRGLEAWNEMIALIAGMPKVVRDTEMVREQQALALNRRNKGADRYQAVTIIEALIAERGASSEACSILGRIYKDMWRSIKNSEEYRARGQLRQAIDAYRRGFQADVRDTLPGVNLVTLLEIEGSQVSQNELAQTLPVVRYGATTRLSKKPDYWDHATLLELAVLTRDDDACFRHLGDALGTAAEAFQPETTATNLRDIKEVRAKRAIATTGLDEAITELEKRAQQLRSLGASSG